MKTQSILGKSWGLNIFEKKYMNQIIRTNRSSIWKKENKNWKIIFHQGTIVNKL